MNESQQRITYLLNKYIKNECTDEEFKEFMEQVNTASNFESFDDILQQQWEDGGSVKLSHQPDWDSMRDNISLRLWALKKKRATSFKYAAVMAIVLSAVALFFYSSKTAHFAQEYITQYSAPAKTKVVVLSDGTRITLNSNSKLRYPEKFDGNIREVFLQGEAYFDVVHDERKPFVIHSGNLKTNVLGTSFNVSAYPGKQAINVTVVTGKVAVKNENTNVLAVLTRGEWAKADPGATDFSTGKLANPEDAIAWINNKIIFENTCLKDVAQTLSNKYNIVININDQSLAGEHITALFQAQELPAILNAITKLTHSKYTHNNHIYTIYK